MKRVYRMVAFGLFLALYGTANATPEHLVISNKPEPIVGPAILYDGPLTAETIRFIYYHKNIAKEHLYIHASIQNKGNTPLSIASTVVRSGPSKDEIFTGHHVTKRFFERWQEDGFERIILAPGKMQQLQWHQIKPEHISTGILRLRTSHPEQLWLKVAIIDPNYPALSTLDPNPLGQDVLVGIFPKSRIKVRHTYIADDALSEIPIGNTPYLNDIKDRMSLQGNYGAIYDIDLTLKNPHPGYRKVQLVFSPVGGAARALMWIDNRQFETSFKTESKGLEPETVNQFNLKPRENRRIHLLTMPQPGSFYPVNFVFHSPVVRYASLK